MNGYFVAGGVISIVMVAYALAQYLRKYLERAPEGYEDENGFHYGKPKK